MNIPRIIHQTWKDRKTPERFRAFTDSWKRHHPSWEYRLWDDDDNRRFIQEKFPWFARLYNNYSLNIQRADSVRYFILYAYGGFYVDLDFECLRSVEPLLKERECVFGIETSTHAQYHYLDRIISNAFMAAAPGNPFFHAIIKDLITSVPIAQERNRFVLETTGPLMINRVYNGYNDKDRITLMASRYLFPLDYEEAEQHLNGQDTEVIRQKLKDAYAIHYHWGSWWKGDGRIPKRNTVGDGDYTG
ncbi:MAG: glycosyltransferase [Thermodesulfobacteriota bacterium]|nr:glycosyltransferase [Thermodesulfobacteriota bacterium]